MRGYLAWPLTAWRSRGFALVLALIAVFPSWPSSARAQNITYSEVKLGVQKHDVHFLGGKERGVDINPEIIFQSPFDDDWKNTVPGYLHWLVQPRPTIGFIANTSGYTNQGYFGATWTWLLASNLITPQDGITFGFFFGPSFNDGEISSPQSDRKSLGSNVLFRESFELGYLITPDYQLSAYFDHISNGGLAKQNQSINNFGARFGFRF